MEKDTDPFTFSVWEECPEPFLLIVVCISWVVVRSKDPHELFLIDYYYYVSREFINNSNMNHGP